MLVVQVVDWDEATRNYIAGIGGPSPSVFGPLIDADRAFVLSAIPQFDRVEWRVFASKNNAPDPLLDPVLESAIHQAMDGLTGYTLIDNGYLSGDLCLPAPLVESTIRTFFNL